MVATRIIFTVKLGCQMFEVDKLRRSIGKPVAMLEFREKLKVVLRINQFPLLAISDFKLNVLEKGYFVGKYATFARLELRLIRDL